MISGIVPFYEIVESVKDETSISNIRPYYDKIRRLIFRAEREIGYGGSVILKKVTYKADIPFKYLKFPEDFIEFEGIGIKCHRVCQSRYTSTSEGIRFKEEQKDPVVLLYWSIAVDDEGYPMVTRNHEEAVVAYIVWKLYSPKIFLGIGNMNAAFDYRKNFENLLLESRGDDAFPTLEEWNELGTLSYTDRRILIDFPVQAYDYCVDRGEVVDTGTTEPPLLVNVFYWQLDSLIEDIDDVIPLITPDYIVTKPYTSFEMFEEGFAITYNLIGRICFAIFETQNEEYVIKDVLDNDITPVFDTFFFEDTKIKLFVSKSVYSFAQITFKIQKR